MNFHKPKSSFKVYSIPLDNHVSGPSPPVCLFSTQTFNIALVHANWKPTLPLGLTTRQNSISWVIKRPDVSYPSTATFYTGYTDMQERILLFHWSAYVMIISHFIVKTSSLSFKILKEVLTCRLQNEALISELTRLSVHNHQMKSYN